MEEIVVTSQMFYPDIAATAKVMTDISLALAQKFQVKVISQNRAYNNPNQVFPLREKLNGVEIKRFPVPRLTKNSNFSRMILSFLVEERTKKECRMLNPKAFLAVSNPPNAAFQVAKVAAKKDKPYVFLLHDLYPDILEKLYNSSTISKFIRKKLRQTTKGTFELASRIIVLGRDVKDYLSSEYSVPCEKIVMITNWSTVRPQPAIDTGSVEDFRKKRKWNDKFIIMYTGNLGETADFDVLLKTAKKLKEISKEIRFVIVGNGRKRLSIENYVKKHNLRNVELLDFVPENEYPLILASADVFYVSLRKELYGISVPSKTYSYLSSGKPILGLLPENSEIALEISEQGFGIVCTDYSVDTLVEKIVNLKDNSKLRSEMGKRAIEVYKSKYTKDKVTSKYISLFDELL